MSANSLMTGTCGPYHGPLFDFHTHLYIDLEQLQPWGRCGKPRPRKDPFWSLLRKTGYRMFERFGYPYLIRSGHPLEKPTEKMLARILRGFPTEKTSDLLQKMNSLNIAKSVVLAIPPVVSNEDVLAAHAKFNRLIPFVSPNQHQPIESVKLALKEGGRGLKLHPVIQQIPLESPLAESLAEVAEQFHIPIMIHAGGSGNMFGMKCRNGQAPEGFASLARKFPRVNMIIAHTGLWEFPQFIEHCASIDNLFADISFQSTESIRKIVDAFGPDKILLGSDSPFGSLEVVLKNLAVTGFSSDVISRIVWKNACRLLDEPY